MKTLQKNNIIYSQSAQESPLAGEAFSERTSSFLRAFLNHEAGMTGEASTQPKWQFNDALKRIAAIRISVPSSKTVTIYDSDVAKEIRETINSGLNAKEQKMFLDIAEAIVALDLNKRTTAENTPAVTAALTYMRHTEKRRQFVREDERFDNSRHVPKWRRFEHSPE